MSVFRTNPAAAVRSRWLACVALTGALQLLGACGSDDDGSSANAPNILFIVMDDVGIDQMEVFGFGGDTPPQTPHIAAIADAGVRFGNTWSMPACTTSRAVFFTARFPLRTNVNGALGPDDLTNSMVSPFEMTTPRLLAQQGYENALFGKFHLALQDNNAAGDAIAHDLGWDYFAGWLDETGDPSSIDTTAGGVAAEGQSFPCGFIPAVSDSRPDGANDGACYMPDGSCTELSLRGSIPPGRICRDQGGVLVPAGECRDEVPDNVDFYKLSGHYVSPLVYNHPDGTVDRVELNDPDARRFRPEVAVDLAVDWINDRPANRPWMATVSFASAHTPLMQPPVDEANPRNVASSALDCTNLVAQRVLSNLMIESMDAEIGRLLVETGLARRDEDGGLTYQPDATNTMVVILGDNGSLGGTVKDPFDITRAKGTAYQTGVWVPLVVAGPLVEAPNRVVSHMVNIADLYALFGEIAGIADVQARVPRPIDAVPLLPYVTNPRQESLRAWNYTEVGANLQVGGTINPPCVISGGCSQIPVSKGVCEDNNGIWWGPGLDAPITAGAPPDGFTYCCEVNQFVVANELVPAPYFITPLVSVGIRNERYKIVENSWNDYVSQDEPCVETTTVEFFAIDEAVPEPKLDNAENELPIDDLSAEQQANYDALSEQLAAIRASVPDCPGDGNIDFVVDDQDLDDWRFYADSSGVSSVYDLNLDGFTDAADQAIIQDNLGLDCQALP